MAYPLRGGTGLVTGKSIPFGFAGRLTVELASLANVLLAYQKKPLTQVELYAALKAARAELPEDSEAFRLWLHRARKQGLE